jgi:hypothetical protein
LKDKEADAKAILKLHHEAESVLVESLCVAKKQSERYLSM